uniref:Uncharacterized protein n=1 Tax=Crocodylus porosus TaxID=8502 RepID=A0A7M4FXU3_CROPO
PYHTCTTTLLDTTSASCARCFDPVTPRCGGPETFPRRGTFGPDTTRPGQPRKLPSPIRLRARACSVALSSHVISLTDICILIGKELLPGLIWAKTVPAPRTC